MRLERMARDRLVKLVLATLLAGASLSAAVVAYRRSTRAAFRRDLAPIACAQCAPCHRPPPSPRSQSPDRSFSHAA